MDSNTRGSGLWPQGPLARHRRRWLMLAAFVALLLSSVAPELAFGGSPVASGGVVLLGFGAAYESDALASSTHRGVDVAASPGARVFAPCAGQVTFAGRVPAVGGGTCGAVSIATDQGSLTLLPVDSVTVSRGAQLATGDAIGTLAAAGDASSPTAHVHVGLRRGDLYVDPAGALAAPEPKPDAPAPAEPQPSPAAQPAGRVPEPAGVSPRSAGSGAVAAAGVQPSAAQAPGSATAPVRVPVAGEQLASGVTLAGGPVALSTRAPAPFAGTESLPGELGTLVRAEARSSAGDELAARASSLAARFERWCEQAARLGGIGAAGILLAMGLLWPLWRRREGEGSGQLLVRPLGEDVVAAVGQ